MTNRDLVLIDVSSHPSPEHIYENDFGDEDDDDDVDDDQQNNNTAYSRLYEQLDGDSSNPNSPEYQTLEPSYYRSIRALVSSEQRLVETIYQAFKHWYTPWRDTYLAGGPEFKTIYELMENLIHYESQILNSPQPLPVERINAVGQAVARLIDYGHAILKLDLIIRNSDETSSEIDPTNVTTMTLFKAHIDAHKLRSKLLYDYFKKDNITDGADSHDAMSSVSSQAGSNTLQPVSSNSLQIPSPRSLHRSHSPNFDRSHKSSISSEISINVISDGTKSPINVQPSQIELRTQLDVQSQLDVAHMTATIRSSAFSASHCNKTRLKMMPGILDKLESLLKLKSTVENITNCFELLDTLLDSIDRLPAESRIVEVELTYARLFKPIVEKVCVEDREELIDFQLAHWASCLLCMAGWMTAGVFSTYLACLQDRADIASFLKNYFFIAKRLTQNESNKSSSTSLLVNSHHRDASTVTINSTFPNHWIEMKLIASGKLINSFNYIYQNLKKLFESNTPIWHSFIECLTCVLNQDCLDPTRLMLRQDLVQRAEALRQSSVDYLLAAWNSLERNQKAELLHELIGPMIHVCAKLESTKRQVVLPILQNMMESDYVSQYCGPLTSDSSQSGHTWQAPSLIQVDSGPQKRLPSGELCSNDDDTVIGTKFTNLIIDELNSIVIGQGLGDEEFKLALCSALSNKSGTFGEIAKHPEKFESFKEMSHRASKNIGDFLQICLDFNLASKGNYKHMHLLCLFKLISFLSTRPELQLNYLYSLCLLHLKAGRKIEAAFTLLYHAETLSSEPNKDLQKYHAKIFREYFEVQGSHQLTDQLSLKILLYNIIIGYFSDAKLWNAAIPLCQVLLEVYQKKTFEFDKVVEILDKMSEFYRKILDISQQSQPEYFRLKFYGLGFPKSLRNLTMICRGESCVKLGDFQAAILSEYPDAKLLNMLSEPDSSLIQQPEQKYLQINACTPVSDLRAQFGSTDLGRIPEASMFYYRYNNCDKFWFDRRVTSTDDKLTLRRQRLNSIISNGSRKNDQENLNEFANIWRERTTLTTNTLPGMLPFFQVSSVETSIISPIECAIEDLEGLHDRLSSRVSRLRADKRHLEDVRSLWQILLGVVDPAVNGGISKYEKAFLATTDRDSIMSSNNQLLIPSSSQFCVSSSRHQSLSNTSSPSPTANHGNSTSPSDMANDYCDIDNQQDNDDPDEDETQVIVAYAMQKDKLKRLIARLAPILDEAIRLHGERVGDSMRQQQDHLENAFKDLRNHIVASYSKYLPPDYLKAVRSQNRSRARSPNSRSMRLESRLSALTMMSGDSRFSSATTSRLGELKLVSVGNRTPSEAGQTVGGHRRSVSSRLPVMSSARQHPGQQQKSRYFTIGSQMASSAATGHTKQADGAFCSPVSSFPYHQLENCAESSRSKAVPDGQQYLLRNDRRRSTPVNAYNNNAAGPSLCQVPPTPAPRATNVTNDLQPQPLARRIDAHDGDDGYSAVEDGACGFGARKPITIRVSPQKAYKEVLCDNGPLNLTNDDLFLDGIRRVSISSSGGRQFSGPSSSQATVVSGQQDATKTTLNKSDQTNLVWL